MNRTQSGTVRTEHISPSNERAALAYLARAPYVNVFVTYLILYDLSPPTRQRLHVAFDGDAVCGVVYYGRQLALACDEIALDAFAHEAKRHRGHRMIIGGRETVRGFWERVHGWHAKPRIVRDRQLVMAVDRTSLKRIDGEVIVRHARAGEWQEVAKGSAALIEQELDYDPRNASADFNANVREMIERQMWWVGESDGRVCFLCNIGPWCHKTAQLQGIWTPPDLRGRGLATASFSAISERLLEHSPTLSLYVNDFNRDAIALYERTGYESVAEFQTILF